MAINYVDITGRIYKPVILKKSEKTKEDFIAIHFKVNEWNPRLKENQATDVLCMIWGKYAIAQSKLLLVGQKLNIVGKLSGMKDTVILEGGRRYEKTFLCIRVTTVIFAEPKDVTHLHHENYMRNEAQGQKFDRISKGFDESEPPTKENTDV